jgi:Uma2 family endonuclease
MATALKPLTTDEFLLWAEGREGRWELFDGVPVMMSPERLAHVRTKARAFNALEVSLRKAGLPCEAMMDGLAIKIDAQTAFEPDASVMCGPPRPDDTIAVTDPSLSSKCSHPAPRPLTTV